MRPALLIHLDDEHAPARRLAEACGLPLAPVQRHRFPDGELRLQLPFDEASSTRPEHLVIYRSLNQPNEKLVELLLLASQARTWGVRHITLVAPYLAYMRQDMSFHPGEVVSQRQIGRLLAGHFDALLTVDPHLHRVATLQEAVPLAQAVTLSAAPWLAAHVGRVLGQAPGERGGNSDGSRDAGTPLEGLARIVLVGPDSESAPWIQAAAAVLGCDFGVCEKVRHGDHDVRIALPELDVAGRPVVLLDDIASSGRTLAVAARALLAHGAASVDVAVTHALFAHDALDTVHAAGVRHVWSTDSVVHDSNVVMLAPLLAQAVGQILSA
ncbi:MAG: ribose-phosphate pyrophosphokinase-like domain-containing protein [Proteobacteria bacterium]|uniref:ribose-phosphate pyrophosphokinase-like domain-containing protein n=1 Tax=Aquabacterium sp. TaxID=1872578 RepID=UPI0035C7140C|nr:ribose-phosphate pyrophosphokinase-like domain-containing protein [Pseudomonadota bacterium]